MRMELASNTKALIKDACLTAATCRTTHNSCRRSLTGAALLCCARRAGLQPLESFLTKAIQLYEMIVVRHGLMLVGQSFGMKTAAYKMLAAALTGVQERDCVCWAGTAVVDG